MYIVQKSDHSQFTSFILSEFEQVDHSQSIQKVYFLWVGTLLIPILVMILGIFNNGEIDRVISAFIYTLYNSSEFLQKLGTVLQYSYFLFLGGAIICLILVIVSFAPKNKEKEKSSSRYASLYLLSIIISFFFHLIIQLIVNRKGPMNVYLDIQTFYQIFPSINGLWFSSFPNNNMTLSGVVIIFPVIFGKRSAVFKWIIGVLSGIIMVILGIIELGLSHAWFTDVFASIGLVLMVSSIIYWHILFIKDREQTDLYHELTVLFYKAYGKVLESKEVLDSGDIEGSKQLLGVAKELYNQSINALQNHSGDINQFISRNEFWKFNVSVLLKELGTQNTLSKKWMYIF